MFEPRTEQNRHPTPTPALLVELPSWPRAFLDNLHSFLVPNRLPPLDLYSAPAPFWPDVFVQPKLPWSGFAKSVVTHFAAVACLIGLSRLIALQPRVEIRPTFEHAQVIYYTPSEYLPPLDTREAESSTPKKADPEFSQQPIISVPREHDNRLQTIVTPPQIKLKRDVALPNIVAWSDTPQRPQLAIPPAPLTAAADLERLAPTINSVVSPPPDPTHINEQRSRPNLQANVVAPPPTDVRSTAASAQSMRDPQNAVIAPPPSVEVASNRPIGDLNIAPSAVIAPAPSLPLAAQRSLSSTARWNSSREVVPPPPSMSSGGSQGSFGARGHVIALNLHPAVGAPPDPPAGNRSGRFAATPEGHAGASGSPGSSASTAAGNGTVNNGSKRTNGLPSGLYVGAATPNSSPVAGDMNSKSSANTVNPNLLASVRPPSFTNTSRSMQPDSAVKLSEAERAVFGNRRFYSVALSMPNLNSAGGSWVIRFAELNSDPAKATNDGATKPAANLSQPMATRKVDPAYPLQLMRENVSGTVIVYAVIHADGSVGNVRVLRGVDERLDRFAVEAVSQWKFEPATKAGVPVDVEATFRIPFHPAVNF